MKNTLKNLKLNHKLTLAIMMIVVVPMIAFSAFLYQNISNNTIWQVKTEIGNRVRENYALMQNIVEFSNMTAQSFLGNQGLKDMLIRLKNNENITAKDYLEFANTDITMLESLVNSNPYLYQVRVYAYHQSFPEMMPILYNERRLEHFPWGKSYTSGEWQINYSDSIIEDAGEADSTHLMALVHDIMDDSGNIIGVLEVAVAMETCFPEMFREGNDTWVHFETADYINVKKDGKSSDGMEIKHVKSEGEDRILVRQEVKELSGIYIQSTGIKWKMDLLVRQKRLLITILLIIMICLAITVDRVVRALLKRFYQMLSVVRKVQDGDIGQRVSNPGGDEMGEMSTQFNKMLDRIQVLMDENVNREILIKNTEIKALQNQINAHFIYNVLEAVKMMAEIHEEYEISDSITALGELLRYGMKWTSADMTIRKELEYIRNYIQLMNLRYDFTIVLSVRVPDYICEQKLPKMTLQPIVENAICHGIEEMDTDATIYIKAVCREEDYDIEITDSGMGMDENQMDMLKKKISGEIEVSGGSGNGIGLKNVQDRIQIRFGEGYGLHVASKEGCFTKVSIHLPYTADTEEKKEDCNENTVNCGR